MASEEVLQRAHHVLALVAKLTSFEGTRLDRATTLSDIGFDSLAYAELAAAAETELGIDLADAGVCRVRTAGDLLDLVERSLARRRTSAAPIYPIGMGRTQWLAKRIAGPALRWWFHLEVRDADRMPGEGPVILCMNHESMLDIPLIVVASPRPVTFMA